MKSPISLAVLLERFFPQRLMQRQASPHTISSYRDTLGSLKNNLYKTEGLMYV